MATSTVRDERCGDRVGHVTHPVGALALLEAQRRDDDGNAVTRRRRAPEAVGTSHRLRAAISVKTGTAFAMVRSSGGLIGPARSEGTTVMPVEGCTVSAQSAVANSSPRRMGRGADADADANTQQLPYRDAVLGAKCAAVRGRVVRVHRNQARLR
jgi:hypothetical protein